MQNLCAKTRTRNWLINSFSFRRALPGFSEYFNSLSDLPDNNARNPWYAEYYSTYCNCSLAENIKV